MERRTFPAADFSAQSPTAGTAKVKPITARPPEAQDPIQDALARQVLEMPGVSRW
jgi:hypothetical protein